MACDYYYSLISSFKYITGTDVKLLVCGASSLLVCIFILLFYLMISLSQQKLLHINCWYQIKLYCMSVIIQQWQYA